jgi:alkanesulfonate monooxygenase SsuD/methylene tetrahydromethanopterin reductase-like flavin-dependent oxidoreductase (luciferase family)
VEIAQEAERNGWAGIWLSEVLDVDVLSMAAAIAVATRKISVGTAVVPLATRSAAVLAMAASTIARLIPGRFSLGLGVSTPILTSGVHDRPIARPLALTRGVLHVVRSALEGKRVDHESDPHVSGLRVPAPDVPPPIQLAALGPRMTSLAIELADGLHLNLLPIEIASDRARTARSVRGANYPVFMLVRTVVDPTAAEELTLRKEVASYLRVPVYRKALAQIGIGVPEAESLDYAARNMPDPVLEALTIAGSANSCRRRLNELAVAGIIPLVVPAAGSAAMRRTISALGGQ